MDDDRVFDLLVVGGGINGTAIARDAAGRGLSVLLCEQDDLAAATSSASTKLIHGGLRYLEHGRLGLVREALAEREILLATAPHLVRPLSFVLPADRAGRPAWMIRAGLMLYDRLAGRSLLPRWRAVDLARHPAGAALAGGAGPGFLFADGRVDDSRLVVANAIDAAERGARIHTRAACRSAVVAGGRWEAATDGPPGRVRARALVDASGPWAARLVPGSPGMAPPRLVQGTHVVVPALFGGDHAYLLQNDDGRIVFAIPYGDDWTLIGTTEMAFAGDPAKARPSPAEIAYLCRAVGRHLRHAPDPAEVAWSFAGLRPLAGGSSRGDLGALGRGYRLDLSHRHGAPLLVVTGGKLTTARRLAEIAVTRLARVLGTATKPWTATAPLPGGEDPPERVLAGLAASHPWLAPGLARRLTMAYGTRAGRILGRAACPADLGRDLGGGLTEAELGHLVAHEWARTAEDVLWRRTKLGLGAAPDLAASVAAWLAESNFPVSCQGRVRQIGAD